MAKSTLDKNLFNTFNDTAKTEAPVQTIKPLKEKKADGDYVGLFTRIPSSLRKKLKVYSVEKEVTQDALIVEILQAYFQDK